MSSDNTVVKFPGELINEWHSSSGDSEELQRMKDLVAYAEQMNANAHVLAEAMKFFRTVMDNLQLQIEAAKAKGLI